MDTRLSRAAQHSTAHSLHAPEPAGSGPGLVELSRDAELRRRLHARFSAAPSSPDARHWDAQVVFSPHLPPRWCHTQLSTSGLAGMQPDQGSRALDHLPEPCMTAHQCRAPEPQGQQGPAWALEGGRHQSWPQTSQAQGPPQQAATARGPGAGRGCPAAELSTSYQPAGSQHAVQQAPHQRQVLRDVPALPQYNRTMMARTPRDVVQAGRDSVRSQCRHSNNALEQDDTCSTSAEAAKRRRTALALAFEQDSLGADFADI